MKLNKNILYSAMAAGLCLATASCTDGYDDFNRNPYGVTKDEMQRDAYAMRSAMLNLESWVIPTDVNTNQFTECLLGGSWGGYIVDSNSGFNNKNFGQYCPEDNWSRVLYKDIIPKVFIYSNEVANATDEPVPNAVATVLKVASIQRVTDAYGPIPYSKVGADGEITADFDSQEDVYKLMFDQLDEAIATLTANRTADFSSLADRIYGGKVENWIKFANSLKLRMAMRISKANSTLAKQKAEEAVNHEIGPMASNADNANLTLASTNPFEIIMYEYNGGDSRISADITSYMNGYNDPRRAAMFTQCTFDGGGYQGMRTGINIPDGTTAHAYSNYNVTTSSPLIIMNSAETAFLRAEGALKGWSMGGTAKELYEQGIRLSFEQWGVSGADNYIADNTSMPQGYKDPAGLNSYSGATSNITIAWDDADTDARKLERIITQKWLANFPLGLEAWSEYRRTGYPNLMPVVVNNSGGTVNSERGARRLPYPQDERTNNAENYPHALQMLGGADNMGTDVWWAK